MFGSFILLLFVVLFSGGLLLSALAIILNFAAKSKGLSKGASQREVATIREELTAIRREIETLRENQAEMTLMLDETSKRRITD